jgi:hypothetical protein
MIESLPQAVTRVTTMFGQQHLTNATGFFFERQSRFFLVTNRHVMLDEASDHRPDRLEIELHVAPKNVAMTRQFSIPLYRDWRAIWRKGRDSAGTVTLSPWNSSALLSRRRFFFMRLRSLTSWSSLIRSKWEPRCSSPVFRSDFTMRCIVCRSRGRRSSPQRSESGFKETAIF